MKNLLIKSFSVMKKQRESSNNQIGPLEKQALVSCLASMGATHIEMTMFSADTADLVAHGFTPSPRSEEDETKQWYDIVHSTPNVYGTSVYGGYLKVFDRVVFPQTGDNGGQIVGFPIETSTPVGTAAGTVVIPYTDSYERISVGADYTTAADGGSGNDWSIASGLLQGPPADGWRRTCLTVATYSNFTATAKIKKVGHQQFVGRATTNSSFPGYGFQLRDSTFRLERPGLENITEVSKSFTENNWYWVKMSMNGTAIKGKVWAADDTNFPASTNGSENEPASWDIEVTRSDFSSGLVGFSGESSTGLFDNLTITPSAVALNSTWVGRFKNYLYNHIGIDRVKVGDIACPFAEITALAFSGSWFVNSGSALTLVLECHKVWNQFCADAGIANQLFLNNPNWTETNSGFWPGAAYADTGYDCFDYYGGGPDGRAKQDGTGYVSQLSTNYAGLSYTDFDNATPGYGIGTSGYPQVWGEWGDLAHSLFKDPRNTTNNDNYSAADYSANLVTVEQWAAALILFFQKIRDGLVNTTPQKLAGFNWWGGWEDQNTSVVYKVGSGESAIYYPNWRGQIIKSFFINDGIGRVPVITSGSFTSDGIGGRSQHY